MDVLLLSIKLQQFQPMRYSDGKWYSQSTPWCWPELSPAYITFQLSLSNPASLPPPLLPPPAFFHRCQSLINTLHTKFYLSICFQRTKLQHSSITQKFIPWCQLGSLLSSAFFSKFFKEALNSCGMLLAASQEAACASHGIYTFSADLWRQDLRITQCFTDSRDVV